MPPRRPCSAPALCLALAACLACGGGAADPKPSGGTCDVFQDAGCLDAGRMKADVDALASAPYAGRRAGTPGNALAVALAESRLAAAGLAVPPGMTGRLQPFGFDGWEATAASLTVGGTPFPLGPGFEVVEDSASGTVTGAAVAFAGYGLSVPAWDPAAQPGYAACPVPATGYDDYAGLDVAGKIVVVMLGAPRASPAFASCPPDAATGGPARWYRYAFYKIRNAARHGAAGVVLVAPYTTADPAPVPFTSGDAAAPALFARRDAIEAVVPALSTWAAQIDGSFAPSSHETSVTASMEVAGEVRRFTASNVLGVVPGTDPALRDEVVVVGAHLDHMGELPLRTAFFPGADDNASGTAVVLELARAVAASPTRPRRSLLFALWNAEELGLIGSCHYVNAGAGFPLARTVAAFSVDMVGAGSPGLELWGATDFPWIAPLADANAAALGLGHVVPQPALTASDHACFLYPDSGEAGVPGFLASTPTILEHPTYHTVNDVAAGVPAENLGAAARLLWASVRGLANGASPWTSGNALRAPATEVPEQVAERVGPGFRRGR